MKTITFAVFLFTLFTSQAFAQMECGFEERDIESFKVLDFTPPTLIDDGDTKVITLRSGATLTVRPSRAYRADGEPLGSMIYQLELKSGHSVASTWGESTLIPLTLRVNRRELRTSCSPVIGK